MSDKSKPNSKVSKRKDKIQNKSEENNKASLNTSLKSKTFDTISFTLLNESKFFDKVMPDEVDILIIPIIVSDITKSKTDYNVPFTRGKHVRTTFTRSGHNWIMKFSSVCTFTNFELMFAYGSKENTLVFPGEVIGIWYNGNSIQDESIPISIISTK
jgi:hypothetical protein